MSAGQDGEHGQLSSQQRELLRSFNRTAGRTALNRPFAITGQPPSRRLERPGLTIETAISDDEIFDLARAGYLSYQARSHSVSFNAKAFDRQVQANAMPAHHLSPRGLRLGRLHMTFGKYWVLTFVRPVFVLAAIALGILYLTHAITATSLQTWVSVGGLLIAALALQIPQRGR